MARPRHPRDRQGLRSLRHVMATAQSCLLLIDCVGRHDVVICSGMNKIVKVDVLKGYRIDLTFADGTQGIVDLSDLAGRGVFSLWSDYAAVSYTHLTLPTN